VLGHGHKFFENQSQRCEIIYFVKKSFLIDEKRINILTEASSDFCFWFNVNPKRMGTTLNMS